MPGNPDGSYIQRVPLTEHTSAPSAIIKAGATRLDLKFPDDFVAWSFRREPQVNVSGSELVFVGYGVVAPEYAWDDYKGVDLKGKTLLMLINDPQIPVVELFFAEISRLSDVIGAAKDEERRHAHLGEFEVIRNGKPGRSSKPGATR